MGHLIDTSGLQRFWNNIKRYFTTLTATNLLHNADWGYSLVNQRSHSGAVSNKYCIDRWIGNGTVTPSAGSHIALASGTTMKQYMEIIPGAVAGKKVTFSYEDSAGNINTVKSQFDSTISASENVVICGGLTVKIGYKSGTTILCGVSCSYMPYIIIQADSAINIRRVWLELGEVCHMETTPPLDYATNLYICGRYFYAIPGMTYGHFSSGFGKTTSTIWAYFPLINRFRIPEPNIEGSTTTNLVLNQDSTKTLTVNSVRVDATSAFIEFQVASSVVVGQMYDIDAGSTVPHLALTADLN